MKLRCVCVKLPARPERNETVKSMPIRTLAKQESLQNGVITPSRTWIWTGFNLLPPLSPKDRFNAWRNQGQRSNSLFYFNHISSPRLSLSRGNGRTVGFVLGSNSCPPRTTDAAIEWWHPHLCYASMFMLCLVAKRIRKVL